MANGKISWRKDPVILLDYEKTKFPEKYCAFYESMNADEFFASL